MTTDNEKPAVITAAQFVAGGYAERIAAGECVVTDEFDLDLVSISDDDEQKYVYVGHFANGDEWGLTPDTRFTVHWLPATPSTDDEVTRLRAENARLREALVNARFDVHFIKEYGAGMMQTALDLHTGRLYDKLTAALDATGEAS